MPDNWSIRELDKSEYPLWNDFVDSSPQGSIFNKSWWLDAVSDSYRILVCENGKGILGGIALPYYYGKIYRNPKLTPALGILLGDFTNFRQAKRISLKINLITALIKELPDYLLFDYVFSENYDCCLPFKWEGFRFDIENDYIIKELENLDFIYGSLKASIRNRIKRALSSGIKISDDLSADDFYELDILTYDRQNMEMTYKKELLNKLDLALEKRNARKILSARDSSNNLLGAIYLVFDKRAAHWISLCSNDAGRKLGIPSLLAWESIKFASTVSGELNFEGSSIKDIEAFMRGFGGKLVNRFRISRCSLPIRAAISILKTQRNLLRKIGAI